MSTLVFLFVLSVLVVVHEFGHFLAARWMGVRVEKFSIGFGPELFGKRFGDTDFVFSLLPLGGFVKLAGERPEESSGMKWEFHSRNPFEKFLIVFAGPFMNAFLAFVIFSSIFCFGQPVLTSRIGKVMDDTPAREAGLAEGDRVIAVNRQKTVYWEDVLKEVHKNGDRMVFTVERNGAARDFMVIPRKISYPKPFGKKVEVAFVGVRPSSDVVYVKTGVLEAIRLGAERVWLLTVMIFYSLGLMVTGALPFKDSLTGPIGIFFMTQQAAQMGVIHLFNFMASLSVSLFVLNLLPVPVLDGGHLLFILIERLKGSPLKESVKERMTQGGLIALLALMAFVIFQDVHRYSILENIRNLFK